MLSQILHRVKRCYLKEEYQNTLSSHMYQKVRLNLLSFTNYYIKKLEKEEKQEEEKKKELENELNQKNERIKELEVMLIGVEINTEVTTAYSPVTYGHLCYFVNGMLSMPGGIEGLFNIFEVDEQTMTYDLQAMAADIEEYGLFTYEEFYEIYPISEEVFEAFNGEYLKVAIGKGLITYERIAELIERYSEFF